MIKPEAPSSRPEAAFVLLLLQSLFWLIAGLSAAPFVLGGEIHMAGLVVATLLLASEHACWRSECCGAGAGPEVS